MKPLTTKGDLYTYSTDADRLAVGSNDYLLTADSTKDEGIKWAWEVLDEDDMASDSAAKLSTQQSIKAYVDSLLVVTGWVNSSDSWTYASATTITVPAGAASLYTKGDRIRLKQGGAFKYWVLAAVANTTLTIIETDDHTLANAAITVNYYSHADKPVGFPSKFSWTPSWTGFSSDPTEQLEYTVSGGRVFCVMRCAGTSNNAGFEFTIPTIPIYVESGRSTFLCAVQDNGSWLDVPGILAPANTVNSVKIGIDISSQAGSAFAGFTASGSKGCQALFHYPL